MQSLHHGPTPGYFGRTGSLIWIALMAFAYAFQVLRWRKQGDAQRQRRVFFTVACVAFVILNAAAIYRHWPN